MFATTPASPFVATITKVSASWLNYVRAALPATIDTIGGGTYNIGAGNTIDFPAGGGGWSYECLVSLSNAVVPNGGFLTIANGGTETVASGGQILVPAGGAINISGNSAPFANGYINILQYGFLSVANGGFLVLNGAMTLGGTGSITLGPDAGIVWGPGTSGHNSIALFNAYSQATWINGSTLQGTGTTAIFTWAGPMTVSGAMTVTSTGSIAVASGGSLTTDLPASTVAVGANNIKSLGVTKSWGEIAVNASASPTVSDGFNVASVSASGTAVSVVFAQNMANAHYSVTFSTQSFTNASGQQWPHPFVTAKSTTGFSVEFRQSSQNSGGTPPWNAGDLIVPTATGVAFPFSFDAHGRQ